mgnify:FL=1
MEDIEQIRKNRAVLLLIAGIPVTMILTATWLWFFVVKGDLDLVGVLGTANRGSLLQPPRQLDELGLVEDTGVSFKYADLEPKWSMLVPVAWPGCNRDCEQSLYVTRQIHIAMGKEFTRIRRMAVSDTPISDIVLAVDALSDGRPLPENFAALLASDHRGTKGITLESGGFARLFPEHEGDPSTWYLVDPGGWIMMTYNSEIPYKDVISDLKFLLKNSGG